jgi:hypothetical protein
MRDINDELKKILPDIAVVKESIIEIKLFIK